jgi:polyisoprenoid-binding protein YceI
MKNIILILLSLFTLQVSAQKYLTKTGKITFTSKTPLETIEGVNKSVASLLDIKTGSLEFIVQIKSFVFDRQLLQEHFNENYMESNKIPKASFKGSVTNLAAINFAKDGEYRAEVSGVMTIHNVSKEVKNTGKIIVKGGMITIVSDFSILLADYNISIPGAVKDKISKDVKVSVNCALSQVK